MFSFTLKFGTLIVEIGGILGADLISEKLEHFQFCIHEV